MRGSTLVVCWLSRSDKIFCLAAYRRHRVTARRLSITFGSDARCADCSSQYWVCLIGSLPIGNPTVTVPSHGVATMTDLSYKCDNASRHDVSFCQGLQLQAWWQPIKACCLLALLLALFLLVAGRPLMRKRQRASQIMPTPA